MVEASKNDASNGYEAIAEAFMSARSEYGADIVSAWAMSLPKETRVLELGAGHGVPITSALLEAGLHVTALDAAPSLVAAFRTRHPHVEIVCEDVRTSTLFAQTFDAVVAVGLVFLLSSKSQIELIQKIAKALAPGGALLFSAPLETGTWLDLLTQQPSISLGQEIYERTLIEAGFGRIETRTDAGGSNYFLCLKG